MGRAHLPTLAAARMSTDAGRFESIFPRSSVAHLAPAGPHMFLVQGRNQRVTVDSALLQ
jgi:hypothetical protein